MTDGTAEPPDPAALVGRTWSGDPVAVERREAFLWAEATRDPDDRFRYPREGVQYAPPTFAQVIARRAAGTGDLEAELRGPDPGAPSAPTVFLGGLDLDVGRLPAVGRTYAATAEAVTCERKAGSAGSFDLLTVEYRVEDEDGAAFDLASDFVVRPGTAGEDAGKTDPGGRARDPGHGGAADSGGEARDPGDGGAGDPGGGEARDPGGGGVGDASGAGDPGDWTDAEAGTDPHDEGDRPGERLPEGPVDPDGLEPGTVAARRVVTGLSPADMRTVAAIVGDPNPIHFDPAAAAAAGHPGRVTQGPVNAAYAGQAALSLAGSPADLRSLSVRYEGFAHEGETVVATATVERVRAVAGGRPELDLRLEATAGDGRPVVTGSATVRLRERRG